MTVKVRLREIEQKINWKGKAIGKVRKLEKRKPTRKKMSSVLDIIFI